MEMHRGINKIKRRDKGQERGFVRVAIGLDHRWRVYLHVSSKRELIAKSQRMTHGELEPLELVGLTSSATFAAS